MHRFLGNGLPRVKRLANFTSGLPTSPALGSTSHLIYGYCLRSPPGSDYQFFVVGRWGWGGRSSKSGVPLQFLRFYLSTSLTIAGSRRCQGRRLINKNYVYGKRETAFTGSCFQSVQFLSKIRQFYVRPELFFNALI